MSQFWAIYKKVDFVQLLPPFWAFLDLFPHFSEKWQHLLKRLMVFHLHAKKYKKRLNGSKDIVIWKIKQSDWSRAFAHKSREFSQIWDLRRKLANHKMLHFRSFLAKTNDSILHKSPKVYFGAFFHHFWENENFPEKSGSVTFEHLWTPNLMQNIRKE